MVTLMRVTRKSPLLLPMLKPSSNSPLILRVRTSLIPSGNTLQAQRKLSSSASGGLGVESQGVPVDVVDGIAGEMVTWVGLFVGAGEDAGGGDAEGDEGGVVGRFTEFSVIVVSMWYEVGVRWLDLLPFNGLALLAEPGGEDIASDSVSGLASLNPVLGLRRTDHVVVEVEANAISFLLSQLLAIVVRSSKAAPKPCVSTTYFQTDCSLLTLQHPTKQIAPCSCNQYTWQKTWQSQEYQQFRYHRR